MAGNQAVPSNRSWIGAKEAADLLGCTRNHLYRRYTEPGWPPYRRILKDIRWDRQEFLDWISSKSIVPGKANGKPPR